MDDEQPRADAIAAVYFRAEDLARRTVEYHRVREAEHRSRERFGRRFTPFPWSEAVAAVLSDEALEDESTVVALIRELGRQGCSEVALAALDMVVTRGSPPVSKAMFDATILVCATEYQDQRCLDQYDRMRSMGLTPDMSTVNLVLTGLCCRGRLARAVELLGEMRSQLGLRPNSYSVLMVLQACNYKRRGAYREAIDAVQALEAGGRTANEEVIEALLQVCEAAMRHAPSFEAAVAVFSALAELHLADSTRVYNGLLGAAGRAGRWREAQALYAQMQEDDVPASLETHTALIQACVVGRALDHALDIFEHLVAGRSAHEAVPASIATYNHLIHACHQAGMLEKALEIAAWVQKTGVEFDDETYGELMATIDVAQLWDDKAMKQARQRHKPVLPRHLRPAPYDAMRVMYLDHLEALQQEELLAMEKLGGQGSWAPKSLTRGSVAPGTSPTSLRSTTTPPLAISISSSTRSLVRAAPSVAAISVIGAYDHAAMMTGTAPGTALGSTAPGTAVPAGSKGTGGRDAGGMRASTASPPVGHAAAAAAATAAVEGSHGSSSSRSPSPQRQRQMARAASVKQLLQSLSTRPLPVLGAGAAAGVGGGVGLSFRGSNAALATPPPGPTGFHDPPTWAQIQTLDAATAGPGGTPFSAVASGIVWLGPDGGLPATAPGTANGGEAPPPPASVTLPLALAIEPANLLYGQPSSASVAASTPRKGSFRGLPQGAASAAAAAMVLIGGPGLWPSVSGGVGGAVGGVGASGGANMRVMVPGMGMGMAMAMGPNSSLPFLGEPVSPRVLPSSAAGGGALVAGLSGSISPRTLAAAAAGPAGPGGAAGASAAANAVGLVRPSPRHRSSRSTIAVVQRGPSGAVAPGGSGGAGNGGVAAPADGGAAGGGGGGAGEYQIAAAPLPAIAIASGPGPGVGLANGRRYPAAAPALPGTAGKAVPAAAVASAAF